MTDEITYLTVEEIDEIASNYDEDSSEALASMFADTTYRRLTNIDGIKDPSQLADMKAVVNYYSHAAVAFKHPNIKLLTLDRSIVGNTAEIKIKIDHVSGETSIINYNLSIDMVDNKRRLSFHVKP